ARSPLSLAALFERDCESLPILLQILSTSQFLSDQLVQEPATYDLLRMTEGAPVSRKILIEDVLSEVKAATDLQSAATILNAFKHREIARIAYGDIIRAQRLDVITRQLSYLADAACEAALVLARQQLMPRFGNPFDRSGNPCGFVILGLGKLGGLELNYSSDIDLMFMYAADGQTDGRKSIGNQEYFDRLARHLVRILTESTVRGSAYRVDLRLRPEGKQGLPVIRRDAAERYYDISGRTWERQAFIKARAVAGDLKLGDDFLAALQPWIYRKYLSHADISGIKTLKRKIEKRAAIASGSRDVKVGHGGIRDVEFVIQFLQLLNGSELPQVRSNNTLDAIARLEQAGCLNMQERTLLTDHYEFLRKIEHRLQIMYDGQTHQMPTVSSELRKLAIRMGFADNGTDSALAQFERQFSQKTDLNRKILDHLLHDAFVDPEETEPEVDLVLDPSPSPESIAAVLSAHGFADPQEAYRNLMDLATERAKFLSTRRSRHFLASIAPKLLRIVATTPNPDVTLVTLSRVSDSLGGKGVLWELFSSTPALMKLYVRLCAACPYLAGLLTSNPGMIDELMDSLVVDHLPSMEVLREMLDDMCRGAQDIQPMLHSFKNSMHLRVGVRDILSKDDVRETTHTLSDVAETLLHRTILNEYEGLTKKFGIPTLATPRTTVDDRAEVPCLPLAKDDCDLVILGMGKLGGQEPNYHSDLDIIFLYEDDGRTRDVGNRKADLTSNQHFYSELGQRTIKTLTNVTAFGRLYEVDPRLRPTGKSGSLAFSFAEFERYFREGDGQLWERQALCKARPVFGSSASRHRVMEIIRGILQVPWEPAYANQIHDMRLQMQENATRRNLKRGAGGTVDIEFIVQMLQLKYAQSHPEILVPGTLRAIEKLGQLDLLSADDAEALQKHYRFLRSVEARLRLMNTTARHDLPDDKEDLSRLAYLLNLGSVDALVKQCGATMADNRTRFEQVVGEHGEPVPTT
ncbi:MAG: bifunctional [glutamate--ammonia ligase]-adenylyl-L-tyrosine phosphorylase/[glutamate--ammonia-ligase] adenylyltransferase, partial [Planctomycetota bacterium]